MNSAYVQIFVGAELQRFQIPKDRICAESRFFNAAFNGKFIEAQGTMLIPEKSPELFHLFTEWLNAGSLMSMFPQPDLQHDQGVEFMNNMLDLYFMSQEYLVEMLEIQCTERIEWAIRKAHPGRYLPTMLDSEAIYDIWANSNNKSLLRQVIVEGLANWFHGDTIPLPVRLATLPYKEAYLGIPGLAGAVIAKMQYRITALDDWLLNHPSEQIFHSWLTGLIQTAIGEVNMIMAFDATRDDGEEMAEDEVIDLWQETFDK